MSTLKQLLYSDLAQHYLLEGIQAMEPNFLRLLCRLAHPRFLPSCCAA